MKAKSASLEIEINVECENCGHNFNLFDQEYLTEEGLLYDIVLPEGGPWGCENLDAVLEHYGRSVTCPLCKNELKVGDVVW